MAHDYDPAWDYDLDRKASPFIRGIVKRLLVEHRPVLEALELSKPKIYYVKGLNVLARYINGTRNEPVIVMDASRVEETADRYGVRMEDAVESTLLHEYGHAYYDARDEHDSMKPKEEERRVEDFAHTFWEYRDVDEAIVHLRHGR